MHKSVCGWHFLPAFEKYNLFVKMERAQHSSMSSWQSSCSWMWCINQLIVESCRWEQCTVGQIVRYVQQLARDYYLYKTLTAIVLRENNMVYKTCCKAVSVSLSSTNNPTLCKQQRRHSHCVGFIFVIQTDLVGQSVLLYNVASSVNLQKLKMLLCWRS